MGSCLARVCRISTILYLQRMKALAGTVLCARRAKVEQTESRLPLTVLLPWPAHFNHLIPYLRTGLPFHTPARVHAHSESQRHTGFSSATFGVFFVGFGREDFAARDEANEWNVKILGPTKNITTQWFAISGDHRRTIGCGTDKTNSALYPKATRAELPNVLCWE